MSTPTDVRRLVTVDSDLQVIIQDVPEDGSPVGIHPSARFVSAVQFGAVPGAGDITTKLDDAVTYCKANSLGLFIPEVVLEIGTWTIDDWDFGEVICHADFSASAGDKIVVKTSDKFTWGGNTVVDIFEVQDSFQSEFENISTPDFSIYPKDNTYGNFWNTYKNIHSFSGLITIDVGTFAVNQNVFLNCQTTGLLIKETAANSRECHANDFINCDFTGGFIRNTTAKHQHNFIHGGYIETVTGGRAIVGNFHVFGMNSDVANATFSQPGHSDWRIANTHVAARVADYAPACFYNLLPSGDLKICDLISGTQLPNGFSNNGGTLSVVSDADAPNEVGKSLELTATTGQTSKGINITTTAISSSVAFCIHYEGEIAAVEVYEDGNLIHTLTPDDSVGTWTFFHGAVDSTAGNTVQLRIWVVTSAAGSNRTVNLGYASVTPGRVAVPFAPCQRPRYQDTGGVWYQDDAAAGQTAVVLSYDTSSTSLPTKWVTGLGGAVVGIWVRTNDARTAGSLSVELYIGNTGKGLTATIDNTNTTFDAGYQDIELDTFSANGELDIRVTTDAGWLPVSGDIRAGLILAYY